MADRLEKKRVAPSAPKTIAVPHLPRLSNKVLAVFLLGMVMLVPLPLASNRPQLWTFWTCLVGVLGTCYLVFAVVKQQKPRMPIGKLALPATIFAIFCLYLLFQTVPLPWQLNSLVHVSLLGVENEAVSFNRGATWLMLLRWLGYGLFFYLFLQISVNQNRALQILQVVFLIVVGYAALGLFMLTQWDDTLLGAEKWAYQGFATGSFVNRNSFATFLAMALPIGVVLAFRRLRAEDSAVGKAVGTAMVAAGILIISAALLATGSRMGTLAGAIGTLLTFFFSVWKAKLPAWLTGGIVALSLVAALVFLATFGENLLDRLMFSEIDRNTRWLVFSQTLDAIGQRPWFGYGGGSFQWVFPIFGLPPLSPDLMWDKAHSTYLQFWFELGVIFGTLPIILAASVAWMGLTKILTSSKNWHIPLAGIGALTVAAVHSLVDFSMEIPANAYLLLALLALSVSGNDSRNFQDASLPRRSDS